MYRYRVTYGDNGGYAVKDSQLRTKPTVFRAMSKVACISKAQEMNGFEPADGDEQTYGRQVANAAANRGR